MRIKKSDKFIKHDFIQPIGNEFLFDDIGGKDSIKEQYRAIGVDWIHESVNSSSTVYEFAVSIQFTTAECKGPFGLAHDCNIGVGSRGGGCKSGDEGIASSIYEHKMSVYFLRHDLLDKRLPAIDAELTLQIKKLRKQLSIGTGSEALRFEGLKSYCRLLAANTKYIKQLLQHLQSKIATAEDALGFHGLRDKLSF